MDHTNPSVTNIKSLVLRVSAVGWAGGVGVEGGVGVGVGGAMIYGSLCRGDLILPSAQWPIHCVSKVNTNNEM